MYLSVVSSKDMMAMATRRMSDYLRFKARCSAVEL